MSAFTLDTSGAVVTDNGKHTWTETAWSDLDAFTQGYVEAMISELIASYGTMFWRRFPGFSDLSPEALATILADCVRFLAAWPDEATEPNAGQDWWHDRQLGEYEHFPPLTVSLGDDGKIHLAVAA